MGIALQIVEIATASIPPDLDGARVARVNLKVGKLAAIVPDSLRFCFNVATKDTPLDGAELAIEELPVLAQCNDCGTKWTITEPVFMARHPWSKVVSRPPALQPTKKSCWIFCSSRLL